MRAEPGFFAPHLMLETNVSLYDRIDEVDSHDKQTNRNYVFLTIDNHHNDGKKDAKETKEAEEEFAHLFNRYQMDLQKINIALTMRQKDIYKEKYYLLRPDWHIVWCGSEVPKNLDELFCQWMNVAFPIVEPYETCLPKSTFAQLPLATDPLPLLPLFTGTRERTMVNLKLASSAQMPDHHDDTTEKLGTFTIWFV